MAKHKALLYRFFLVALYLAVIVFLAFLVFAFYTINSTELNKFSKDTERQYLSGQLENVLEEGSSSGAQDLMTFHLFSRERTPFEKWITDLEREGKLQLDKGRILIMSQVPLAALEQNDCSKVYCFQHRISFHEIPPIIWRGLIGIEDYRFINHSGVDLRSILRAFVANLKSLSIVQGGSTLTQQLAKNLFFSTKRSFYRKIKEAIVAVYLETQFTKEEILQVYLNEFDWGALQGMRVKGVYASSLFYFDKKLQELTTFEAAILISLLKGPHYYSPLRNLEKLKGRTTVVLNKLESLNFLNLPKKDWWTQRDWKQWQEKLAQKEMDRPYRNLWQSQKSENNLLSDFELYVLSNSALKTLQQLHKGDETADLAIKIMIKKINKEESVRFYSKVERDLDRAMGKEKHQVGSILKPIIYQLLVKSGLVEFDDLVSTEEITLDLKSGQWSPSEATKKLIPLTVTVEEALLRSYNRPLIRLAQKVGFDTLEEPLTEYIPTLLRPLREYPAQLLGAVELSLQDIVSLYEKFWISECQNPLVLPSIIDPTMGTVRNVVRPELGQLKFMGKTGTSNEGFDNWYVFSDGQNIGAIWVGVENRQLKKGFNLYGSTTSFRVFQEYFLFRGKQFNEITCMTR